MARVSMRRLVIAMIAGLALTAGLAACQATSNGVSAKSSVSAPSGGAVATSPPSSSSPLATGSVTASITSPIALSGTVATPVSCDARRIYRASVTGATIRGHQLSFAVVIVGYRGPGSYSAVVRVTLRRPNGEVTKVARASRVPAVITSAGGSFSLSATGSEGRILSGSLSWVCGS